ncbi:hypothetical protein BDN72DRAFT_955962 [Pluteus cervinus]|uniref:Uncharacterized protein n=2 Tax=Pluteus cervinus TaxID=181527 RepID=A0ACD3B7M9_9AGAR|nr:hypothetical protein BDN72DRAFT_955961 [Pluteus cervinus]TFK74098.1 hypothetical protein BDN72DRAFT_955962 [Pluteus cervinus]
MDAQFLLLPEELLIEIVQVSSLGSIICIRQTCKRLYNISKSAAVWRYIASREHPQPLLLERPVESYTPDDLEVLVLKRRRVEVGFRKLMQGGKSPRFKISLDCYVNGTMHLIRGGRWLLISTPNGGVIYLDLDIKLQAASNLFNPWRILVRERTTSRNYTTHMSIDIDHTSPYLKFNLALLCFSSYLTTIYEIEVWQVTMELNDRGFGVGLQAKLLNSFSDEPPQWVGSVALQGDNLLCTIFVSPSYRTHVVVLPWKEANSADFLKRAIDCHSLSFSFVHATPGQRLFTADNGVGRLIDLSSVPETTTILAPQGIASLQPLATAPFPSYITNLSGFTAYPDGSVRCVASDNKTLYGIVGSSTSGEDPNSESLQVIPLAKATKPTDFGRSIILSDDFCLMWSTSKGLTLRQIAWPTDPSSKSDIRHLTDNPGVRLDRSTPIAHKANFSCLLDASSGRVIVQQRGFLYVYDFALLS